MKDKTKLLAIVLVIVTIFVVVLTALFTKDEEQVDEANISIVTNYSNFYTVNSCLYRVITYLAVENTDNMMLVLDENYKNKNNIQKDNVLDFFPKVEEGSTFVSSKMYFQKLNDNITKYYVEGYIEQNELVDSEGSSNLGRSQVYFIVYLDFENKVFSIEPYSGDIFIGGDKNE